MFIVIDRLEGNYVVCEKDDMTFINIYRYLVPNEAKEGDVLINGDVIRIDVIEVQRRKNEIEKLAKDLWV
jgi:hypothetical protein